MAVAVEECVESLAARTRVLMLGGLAMIAHGLTRTTRDVDIWVDPEETGAKWAGVVAGALVDFPRAGVFDLRKRCSVEFSMLEDVVARDGVIRITGLDRPLDIFRVPHNMEVEDFDAVWSRATMDMRGVRIPEEIDLLLTKADTSRSQDRADVAFLEDRIHRRYEKILGHCDPNMATGILDRYADHHLCKEAMRNPDSDVRNIALSILKEFAEGGDPYAREIINGRGQEP